MSTVHCFAVSLTTLPATPPPQYDPYAKYTQKKAKSGEPNNDEAKMIDDILALNDDEANDAATKLQARMRGRASRRKSLLENSVGGAKSVRPKGAAEGKGGDVGEGKKEEKAARKLQRAVRKSVIFNALAQPKQGARKRDSVRVRRLDPKTGKPKYVLVDMDKNDSFDEVAAAEEEDQEDHEVFIRRVTRYCRPDGLQRNELRQLLKVNDRGP